MLLVFKLSSLFRHSLISFERLAPCSEILLLLSNGLLLAVHFSSLFRNSLVSFERLAPCSETLLFLSSSLLLVFQFSNQFRNSLVSVERFAPSSDSSSSFPFDSLISPFRAVGSLFPILLVSFEVF